MASWWIWEPNTQSSIKNLGRCPRRLAWSREPLGQKDITGLLNKKLTWEPNGVSLISGDPGISGPFIRKRLHLVYNLGLKNAFFSLPLAPQSQEIFAFEWTDEDSQTVGQLTWTCLLLGFKNSPMLFNEAVGEDL